MKEGIDKETALSIFKKGVANNEFFNRRDEGISYVKNLLKIFRLFIYRLFMGYKKKLNSSSLKLAWCPLHEKVLSQYTGETVALLAQKNSLDSQSFISYLPSSKLLYLICSTPKCVRKKGLIYDWFFFNTIYLFLVENPIESIYIAGHYDKYATWLSYLSKEMGVYFTISQHGASSKFNLPYKIHANRVEVLSKAEEDMFRATILSPDETEFNIKGFKSSLSFVQGNFKNRTIAIASQPGYEERVIKLIETIKSIDKSIDVIVYSHPTDRFRRGKLNLASKDKCRLEHQARYWDVDYLIVFTSTLAYDYWSCAQFTGRVLCFYDDNCIVALYYDERGTVIYPQTCLEQLKDILA